MSHDQAIDMYIHRIESSEFVTSLLKGEIVKEICDTNFNECNDVGISRCDCCGMKLTEDDDLIKVIVVENV